MSQRQSLDRGRRTASRAIRRTCASGLDSRELRARLRADVSQLVELDAYCINTADPATLLITGSVGDGLPPEKTARLFELEYGEDAPDVNRLVDLACAREPAGRVAAISRDEAHTSRRMREIFLPIGFGRELRAALMVGDVCWGYLHLLRRAEGRDFSPDDLAAVRSVAPAIASALRMSLVREMARSDHEVDGEDAPGVLVLDQAGAIVRMTSAAARWLSLLGGGEIHAPLPHAIHAVAAALQHDGETETWCRLRAASGEWVVVHGSKLDAAAGSSPADDPDPEAAGTYAIVIERARSPELAPVILLAYELTLREREVTGMVLRGRSNDEIAEALSISTYTVKDHLKAIFEKVRVTTRGELTARVYGEDYAPRIQRRDALGPRGWFR